MTPECQGQMLGHDFPYTGANCTQCGVNQTELSGGGLRRATPSISNAFDMARFRAQPKPIRGIHSEIHSLVQEARVQFGETAKKGVGSFGYYLGFFKRLGALRVRQLLAEAKEAADPKRSFWWKVGEMSRRQKENASNPQADT